jgi:hypothetical protein
MPMEILMGMLLSFGLLVLAEGLLVFLLWRRLAIHLRENPKAVTALTTHLLVPLLRLAKKKSDPHSGRGENVDRG